MDPQTNSTRSSIPKNFIYLILLLVVAACSYLLVTAFRDYQGSGVLTVEAPDAKSLLSVSQTNHQAKFIGQGKASVRLPAGSYEVASRANGGQALAVAVVKKGQTSKITLPKNKDSILPSVLSIDFQNLAGLIDSGLTSTQTAQLKQYFFNFKKNANTVIVNSGTIRPGPHNPNTDIGFSTTFTVSIDSSQYQAVASYIGLDDIRLKLYDATGKLAFDSGV